MSFANKVVLITGGSSGIGAATALLFAKKSASVVIVGRNEAGLKSISEQCKDFGKKPLSIQADITNDDKATEIVKNVIDRFGKLDVLVNNAGTTSVASILKGNLLEEYDRIMSVNLRAVVHLTSLAAPYLIETKGNIINVSSITAMKYFQRSTLMAYAVSKAGLEHFTRGAALDLLKTGVRVNSVQPGLTRTNLLPRNGINEAWESISEKIGMPRVAEPEEVAELICFVASDKAKSINGATYTIDNGALALS